MAWSRRGGLLSRLRDPLHNVRSIIRPTRPSDKRRTNVRRESVVVSATRAATVGTWRRIRLPN